MNKFLSLISIAFLISCTSSSKQEEKIDLAAENDESVVSRSTIKKHSIDELTSKDLIKDYFTNLNKLKSQDRISKYNELKKNFQTFNKENLLLRSIILSDLELAKQLLKELSNKNPEILSDYSLNRIHDRYFEWEKCDTAFIDFLKEKIDIAAYNREDSIYRIIRAINANRDDIAAYYIKNGYSHLINEKANLTNVFDEMLDASPINWSIHKGDTSIAEFFLSKGGVINKESLTTYSNASSAEFTLKKLLSKGYSSKEVLSNSLWQPVLHGDYKKVQKLIQLGCDVNELYENKETPIFLTMHGLGEMTVDPMAEKLKIMDILIKNGAKIDHQNKDGVTPLIYSSLIHYNDGKFIRLGFAELLLAYGAKPELKDKDGNNFWDHVLLNKNETFMKHFSLEGIVPEEYLTKFDSANSANEAIEKNGVESWTPTVFHLKDTASNKH